MQDGTGITITGDGSAGNPFVINADVHLVGEDNVTFDVGAVGAGTAADPMRLSVQYAPTASINDLPDVDTAGKANGQVLTWNGGHWIPAAGTTAPVGAVTHDTSMSGDGSAATPLQIAEDPERLLATRAAGLGLSDTGMNWVVRHFTDALTRSTANPPPSMNALSALDTVPGQVDYWTGVEWRAIKGQTRYDGNSTAFLQLSGAWVGGPVSAYTESVTTTTDASGGFTVLTTGDLTGWAGVLSIAVQPVGAIAWQPVVNKSGGEIVATAYGMGTGAVLANQQISYTFIAHLY